MKRKSIWGIILGTFIIFNLFFHLAYGQDTTINFDELNISHGDSIPQDQYEDIGVIFSSAAGGPAYIWNLSVPSVLVNPSGGVFSLPNAIKGSSGLANVSVVATFVDPQTGQPATTSFVEVGVSSGPGSDLLSSNVALQAYDSDDNLIAQDSADTSLQFEYLSVSVQGIAKVVMVAGNLLDIFDDFTFADISPSTLSVEIDIKPGSDPNCFNNDGHGVIPVAILSDCINGFDATQIDVETVEMANLVVRTVGKGNKSLAHIEDVNGDGCDDLVVQIEDSDSVFSPGSGTAMLVGNLFDGTPFEGSDSICVVP